MKARITSIFARIDTRIVLWSMIAIYTLTLPNAIVVYRTLVEYIGAANTGKIPLISILVVGSAYGVYGYRRNNQLGHLLYLIPSGLIALAIIKLEVNPNKHIHIPEYMLMAWLLYAVFSKDYQGSGIFILVMICGSLLGVVDELEQGIHPRRFYGWSDMLVNSASTLIGIFTLMGVVGRSPRDWAWRVQLKLFAPEIWLLAFGLICAIFMGIQLFRVQAQEAFWGIYPIWLLRGNIIFVVISLFMILARWAAFWQQLPQALADIASPVEPASITARLWVYPLLTIFTVVHTLVILVAHFGLNFR